MRTYSYTVNGARYDVTIESLRDQVAKLNVNGIAFDVEILGAPLTEGDLPEVAAAAVPAATAAPTPWLPRRGGEQRRACPRLRPLWRRVPRQERQRVPEQPWRRARPSLLPSPAW